jgi:type II secretory pathway pseudopilin PulG
MSWRVGRTGADGFAMAALLVAMTIMAIVMTVALPVWHTAMRREREAELIFRGQQYARAVMLYQRRFPGAAPPNLDILINEHLLRKKYKDPITNDDFQLVGAADALALQGPSGGGPPGLSTPGSPPRPGSGTGTNTGAGTASSLRPGASTGSPFGGGGQSATTSAARPGDQLASAFGRPSASAPGTAAGGIMGVVSKSKDTSLRLYNGRNKYNEWVFVATQTSVQAGTGALGGAAGARGRGQQPGANNPNAPNAPGASPFGLGGRGRGQQDGGRGFPPRGDGPGGFGQPQQPNFPGLGGRRNF